MERPMKEFKFVQVDVFTDKPFGGNPLAVFPDADGLSDDEMQKLAREMNLSETTFVLPPIDPTADFKVRIFTPVNELPFAGHPVVGTHWVMASLGRIELQEPVTTVSLELGVGVLPADIHVTEEVVDQVVMTQGTPEFLSEVSDMKGLGKALGLPGGAIADTGYKPQVVSTGLPQLMVPIRSLADIRSIHVDQINVGVLNGICEKVNAETVLVFSTETEDEDYDVHVRVFAPLSGIPEDPATGSANGALGAYLVQKKIVSLTGPTVYIRSEQGLEMGRPSTLNIEVDHDEGEVSTVRVGGTVSPIIQGVAWF